jgi:hypothetical protein
MNVLPVESDEETFIDQHGRSLHLVGADVWNEQERLLLTIQPADQSGEKKPQGRDVDDGESLHQRPMRTRCRSAEPVGHYAQEFLTASHSPVVGQCEIGRNSYSK